MTIQVTTKGKLSITYPKEIDYKIILQELLPHLVKADRTSAEITGIIKTQSEPKGKLRYEQKLKKAIKSLRFDFMRDPTILEIAYDVGETPEAIRETVFKLSPISGWREPSEKEIADAKGKVKRVYELGSVFRQFGNSNIVYNPSYPLSKESHTAIIKRVNYALKNEKDQLPEIVVVNEEEQRTEFKFRWPKISKWYLSGDYTEYCYKKSGKLSGKLVPDLERLKKGMEELLKKK